MSDTIIIAIKWRDTGRRGLWRYRVTKEGVYQTRLRGTYARIEDSHGCLMAELSSNGVLTIYPGYTWNGPNVVPDTKNFMQGSCVHDCLWQMIEERLITVLARRAADLTMWDVNRAAGMGRFYAWLTWRMVASFGRPKLKAAKK